VQVTLLVPAENPPVGPERRREAMSEQVEAEDVVYAIREFSRAERALSSAMEKCEVSPGWYTRHEQDREDEARAELKRTLDAYIDQRIAAALLRPAPPEGGE
jgi:hypothetical protein